MIAGPCVPLYCCVWVAEECVFVECVGIYVCVYTGFVGSNLGTKEKVRFVIRAACQWFSGKIQRCHRWAPGSIPGWRKYYCYVAPRTKQRTLGFIPDSY